MFKTVNGYCPHLKSDSSIDINYSYIPILNSTEENYKATSFECVHAENCSSNKKCPIFINNCTNVL